VRVQVRLPDQQVQVGASVHRLGSPYLTDSSLLLFSVRLLTHIFQFHFYVIIDGLRYQLPILLTFPKLPTLIVIILPTFSYV